MRLFPQTKTKKWLCDGFTKEKIINEAKELKKQSPRTQANKIKKMAKWFTTSSLRQFKSSFSLSSTQLNFKSNAHDIWTRIDLLKLFVSKLSACSSSPTLLTFLCHFQSICHHFLPKNKPRQMLTDLPPPPNDQSTQEQIGWYFWKGVKRCFFVGWTKKTFNNK